MAHRRFVAMTMLLVSAVLGARALSACGSESQVGVNGGPDGSVMNDAAGGELDGSDNNGDTGTDAARGDDAGGPACAALDPSGEIDCTGKCGPVTDPCTRKTKLCGGCSNLVTADGGVGAPQTCDLTTNRCGTPRVTCSDLGAECGTLKNSCGNYLDCPDTASKGCSAGKECDPDTHKCRDCQPVTCKDLGYECGQVFLGCGQDIPANYTDCGSCSAQADGGARKCNDLTHTCEPVCVPKTASQLCNAARLSAKGVECGVISDGCGGRVNCDSVPIVPAVDGGASTFGCPAGQACGVRGIGNRCSPAPTPDECIAAGRNCGQVRSACTGQLINCGDCASGQVCNANGVCGAPCTPKTCADYPQFQCGVFDDGCGGTTPQCGCAGGTCDNVTHTCCANGSCATTYSGKCGTNLPNGCGASNVTCGCTGTQSCTTTGGAAPAPPAGTPGLCCTPSLTAQTYVAAGQCGTNLPNGCGANTVNASCAAGQDCVANTTGAPGPAPASGVVGSCCTHATCPAAPACASIQNSCRIASTLLSCSSVCTGGKTCPNNTTCCTGAPACATGTGGSAEGAECNTVKTPVDMGCGSNRTCTCSGGRTCLCTNGGNHACTATDGAGTCKTPLSCTSAAYNGKCGVGLDNGVGATIACGCPTGQTCSTSTPGALGTCQCSNGLGRPYNCSEVLMGGDACGAFSNGCGGTTSCGCPAGQTCNTTPNPNVCCTPASCPATPGIGTACGTVNNGCTSVSCSCPGGTGNENFTCSAGTCQCVKDTCRGRTGPQPDRCGGTLNCGG